VTRHLSDVVAISIRLKLVGRVGFEPTHLLIENQAALTWLAQRPKEFRIWNFGFQISDSEVEDIN
jgi:hypothetical protein